MNLLKIPEELLRKIICYLPPRQFISINNTCKTISNYNLNHLLIPWAIEALYDISDISDNIDIDTRMKDHKKYFKRYNKTHSELSYIINIYDLIDSINRILKIHTRWDIEEYLYKSKYYMSYYMKCPNFTKKDANLKFPVYIESELIDDYLDLKKIESRIYIKGYNITKNHYIKYYKNNINLKALI